MHLLTYLTTSSPDFSITQNQIIKVRIGSLRNCVEEIDLQGLCLLISTGRSKVM